MQCYNEIESDGRERWKRLNTSRLAKSMGRLAFEMNNMFLVPMMFSVINGCCIFMLKNETNQHNLGRPMISQEIGAYLGQHDYMLLAAYSYE